MSETLDPEESGREAAVDASPELLMAGHSEMKRRLKSAASAPPSLLRESLWLRLPEFPGKVSVTLVQSSLSLIYSFEDTLQKLELQVTGFSPPPLISLSDVRMMKPCSLKRCETLSFLCVDKRVFTLTVKTIISHSTFNKYHLGCDYC